MSPRHSGSKQRTRIGPRVLTWGLVVFLVCALAGYMLVMNINTNRSTLTSYDTRGLLEDRSRQVTNLQNDITDLSSQIDTINKTLSPDSASTDAATNDSSSTMLTALTGPGLIVTLTDSPLYQQGNIGSDKDPNDYVVHQQDLEGVINALWHGGAEAMMIQDQRVLPTTAVRCKGNVLLLQGKSYAPPFTVSAIGPVDQMNEALNSSKTIQIYKEYVDSIGLGWDVRESQALEFPKASSALQTLNYAKPLTQDGKSQSGTQPQQGSQTNPSSQSESESASSTNPTNQESTTPASTNPTNQESTNDAP